MKTPKVLILAFVSVAFANSAIGKSLRWLCVIPDPPHYFSFAVDLASRTIDGKPAQFTPDASGFQLTVKGVLGPSRESAVFTLAYPSGHLTADASQGRMTGQCRIPDDAVADLTSGGVEPKQPSLAQSPAAEPTATPASNPPSTATDTRYAELARVNDEIYAQVKTGKARHQRAAQLFRKKFLELFPEVAGNALLMEYFAYAELLGEKIDQKKLTVAEAQYELTRKMSELQERQARLQAEIARGQAVADQKSAQESAARREAEEAAARRTAEEVAARRASDVAEQRLAVERQMLEQQQQMQRQQRLEYLQQQQRLRDKQRQENLQAILKLLTPPKPNMTTCTGSWMGSLWTSNCTRW